MPVLQQLKTLVGERTVPELPQSTESRTSSSTLYRCPACETSYIATEMAACPECEGTVEEVPSEI